MSAAGVSAAEYVKNISEIGNGQVKCDLLNSLAVHACGIEGKDGNGEEDLLAVPGLLSAIRKCLSDRENRSVRIASLRTLRAVFSSAHGKPSLSTLSTVLEETALDLLLAWSFEVESGTQKKPAAGVGDERVEAYAAIDELLKLRMTTALPSAILQAIVAVSLDFGDRLCSMAQRGLCLVAIRHPESLSRFDGLRAVFLSSIEPKCAITRPMLVGTVVDLLDDPRSRRFVRRGDVQLLLSPLTAAYLTNAHKSAVLAEEANKELVPITKKKKSDEGGDAAKVPSNKKKNAAPTSNVPQRQSPQVATRDKWRAALASLRMLLLTWPGALAVIDAHGLHSIVDVFAMPIEELHVDVLDMLYGVFQLDHLLLSRAGDDGRSSVFSRNAPKSKRGVVKSNANGDATILEDTGSVADDFSIGMKAAIDKSARLKTSRNSVPPVMQKSSEPTSLLASSSSGSARSGDFEDTIGEYKLTPGSTKRYSLTSRMSMRLMSTHSGMLSASLGVDNPVLGEFGIDSLDPLSLNDGEGNEDDDDDNGDEVDDLGASLVSLLAPNLLDCIHAFLLSAFAEANLLPTLVKFSSNIEADEAALSEDRTMSLEQRVKRRSVLQRLRRKATVLAAELLGLSSRLLSAEQCVQQQWLPQLLSRAAGFQDTADGDSTRASAVLLDLSSYTNIQLRRNQRDLSEQLASPVANMPDKGKSHIHHDQESGRISLNSLSPFKMYGSNIEMLAIRSRLVWEDDSKRVGQLQEQTRVLESKDYSKWDWVGISNLVDGLLSSRAATVMAHSNTQKWLRRLMRFYNPQGDGDFAHLEWVPSSRYVNVLLQLVDAHFSAGKVGRECMNAYRFVQNLAHALSLEVKAIEHGSESAVLEGKAQSERIFHPSSVVSKMSREFFSVIGVISRHDAGRTLLVKYGVWAHLKALAGCDAYAACVPLMISPLDVLNTAPQIVPLLQDVLHRDRPRAVRLWCTRYLAEVAMAPLELTAFDRWGPQILLPLLNDKDSRISRAAIRILEEVFSSPLCASTIVSRAGIVENLRELGGGTLFEDADQLFASPARRFLFQFLRVEKGIDALQATGDLKRVLGEKQREDISLAYAERIGSLLRDYHFLPGVQIVVEKSIATESSQGSGKKPVKKTRFDDTPMGPSDSSSKESRVVHVLTEKVLRAKLAMEYIGRRSQLRVPRNPFGELARTRKGCKLLEESGFVAELVKSVDFCGSKGGLGSESFNQSDHGEGDYTRRLLKLRGHVLTLGAIASSRTGIELVEKLCQYVENGDSDVSPGSKESAAVKLFVNVAESCLVSSLRGAAVFALGMLSMAGPKTRAALLQCGWCSPSSDLSLRYVGVNRQSELDSSMSSPAGSAMSQDSISSLGDSSKSALSVQTPSRRLSRSTSIAASVSPKKPLIDQEEELDEDYPAESQIGGTRGTAKAPMACSPRINPAIIIGFLDQDFPSSEDILDHPKDGHATESNQVGPSLPRSPVFSLGQSYRLVHDEDVKSVISVAPFGSSSIEKVRLGGGGGNTLAILTKSGGDVGGGEGASSSGEISKEMCQKLRSEILALVVNLSNRIISAKAQRFLDRLRDKQPAPFRSPIIAMQALHILSAYHFTLDQRRQVYKLFANAQLTDAFWKSCESSGGLNHVTHIVDRFHL